MSSWCICHCSIWWCSYFCELRLQWYGDPENPFLSRRLIQATLCRGWCTSVFEHLVRGWSLCSQDLSHSIMWCNERNQGRGFARDSPFVGYTSSNAAGRVTHAWGLHWQGWAILIHFVNVLAHMGSTSWSEPGPPPPFQETPSRPAPNPGC